MTFEISCDNQVPSGIFIQEYDNFQSLQVTIRPVVKEVITSCHVITWRYLLTLLPFKQLNERTLMYIHYKALSFGKNVRIKNFFFFFFFFFFIW